MHAYAADRATQKRATHEHAEESSGFLSNNHELIRHKLLPAQPGWRVTLPEVLAIGEFPSQDIAEGTIAS